MAHEVILLLRETGSLSAMCLESRSDAESGWVFLTEAPRKGSSACPNTRPVLETLQYWRVKSVSCQLPYQSCFVCFLFLTKAETFFSKE